jgi:hypothetical protein
MIQSWVRNHDVRKMEGANIKYCTCSSNQTTSIRNEQDAGEMKMRLTCACAPGMHGAKPTITVADKQKETASL